MASRADVADTLHTLRALTANSELEVQHAGAKTKYLYDGMHQVSALGTTSTQIERALTALVDAHYTLRTISR